MTKEKQDQTRRAFWQNHIQQWKRSGMSQSQYCSRHKINKNTLGYWIKKRIAQDPVLPGFVQIPVKVMSSNLFEIIVNDRYKIQISGGFDTELLKAAIKTLEQLS